MRVEFTATAGQLFKFTYSDNKSCGATPQIDLPIYKAALLTLCNQGNTYQAPATGTYAITIDPPGAALITSKVKINAG